MSMLTLYQIGALALNIKTEEDRWDTYRARARESATPLLASGSFIAPYERYQVRLPELSVRGKLLGTSARSGSAFDQQMRGYVGVPTTLIAYIPKAGGGAACASEVIWLQATGRLVDYSTDRSNNRLPEIDLTVEVTSHWRTLDPYLWEPGPGGDLSKPLKYNRQPSAPYPVRDKALRGADWMLGREDCVAWWFTNPASLDYVYDPAFWAARYAADVDPDGGSAQGWGRSFGFRELFVNSRVFSGPVVSLYAFRGMVFGTTLTLRTLREGPLGRINEVTTVDVSALHNTLDAAGFTGIDGDDVLLMGDIQRIFNGRTYRPAFILRNGEVVEVQLAGSGAFSYQGDFPGQLSAGLNRFLIDIPAQTEVAWVHIFQRL